MTKSEIEFAAEQTEKMTEMLRNGILVAHTYLYTDVVDYMIAHGATIPVLCKECIHRKERVCAHPCAGMWIGTELKDNDFCSYGERREGE